MSSIQLKKYPISCSHDDKKLTGYIEYWSKDYRVVLEQPFRSESNMIHMMYMIPARFTTPLDRDTLGSDVKCVDIVSTCINTMKQIYDKEK